MTQFIIDNIPDIKVNEFVRLVRQFQTETNCQFRYKEGASIKYPMKDVPKFGTFDLKKQVLKNTLSLRQT